MLEDEIYNEQIEDDPDDLERIIEGEDNTEGNNHLDYSGSEAEEDNNQEKKQNEDEENKKVEPKRKRTLNPQPKLNAERLQGPRGIGILESFFKDVKLKGKGHEKEDLDMIMGRLEHWAHRLFPRFKFDDCLERLEKLGTKRPIQNYLRRIRLGMDESDVHTPVDQSEEIPPSPPAIDPFDELIGQRPSRPPLQPVSLTQEQRERMLRNRMIAEERRMARMKALHEKQKLQDESDNGENINVDGGTKFPGLEEGGCNVAVPRSEDEIQENTLSESQIERMEQNQRTSKEFQSTSKRAKHEDTIIDHEIQPEEGTNSFVNNDDTCEIEINVCKESLCEEGVNKNVENSEEVRNEDNFLDNDEHGKSVDKQNFLEEAMDIVENPGELIDENNTKVYREGNDTNAENSEVVSSNSIIDEQKLDHDKMNVGVENTEKMNNENNSN